MTAAFHFLQSNCQQFSAYTAAPSCRMRCQADDIRCVDGFATQAQRIRVEMGQAGHIIAFKAHEDVFRLIKMIEIPLEKWIFPVFKTIVPKAFDEAPVQFSR